jgi:hypothetical protein
VLGLLVVEWVTYHRRITVDAPLLLHRFVVIVGLVCAAVLGLGT